MLQPTRRWEWLGALQSQDFEASLPKNGVSLTLVENTASAAATFRWFPSPPSPLSPSSPLLLPSLFNAEDCGGIPAWRESPPTRLRHARGGSGRAGDGGDTGLPWKALEAGEGKLITWHRHQALRDWRVWAAREPGKPVAPLPWWARGAHPHCASWKGGRRALSRDVTPWSGPKVFCPRSLPVWKHIASPFLPGFCSSHLPAAALKSLPRGFIWANGSFP